MKNYQFPEQKVLCDKIPYSLGLLNSLLEMAYAASPPFTGYLKFTDIDSTLYFLFFFNGAPYSVGCFADGKPSNCSVRQLGWRLASSADKSMSVSLCETDPVLLKNMLLFLLEEPDVKAPAALIDIEYVVRQIGEAGTDAMIALCCDKKINFFFFWNGKGARANYSDISFERPEGMTVDEEMLLYAFQSGRKVQAYVYRGMTTTVAEDLNQLDKDSLYKLITDLSQKSRRREDSDASQAQKTEGGPIPENVLHQKQKIPNLVLFVESGPLQGEYFTVTLPCIIGRSDCDLKLDDKRISRRHAELRIVDNKPVIEDLASTNGTKVNGETVTVRQLNPNDLISIGLTNLRISTA